ncbi:COP9 signalosome complex subunit 8-like [Clavelina lepadiformis]|uniref:COP9 signalosome complex subunit 8 n=1 Tax=Clavelina lepadiformis TaxID=159417 RepID=A0ABP0G015_CLALP
MLGLSLMMDSESTELSASYSHDEALKRLEVIENQELDSPQGKLTAEVYREFLALYLLNKDVINAKFLWQRIPFDIKNGDAELQAVWTVGKSAWKHDYAGVHAGVNAYEWSGTVKRIMHQYKVDVQEHCLNLVAGGYTSIKLQYMANILGLSDADTIEAIQRRGWSYLMETNMIKPVKNKKEINYSFNNEEHLERLTQHILFLET